MKVFPHHGAAVMMGTCFLMELIMICANPPPVLYSIVSPATQQVISYLAHGKQPNEKLSDPQCRVKSYDMSLCNHVLEFWNRRGEHGPCREAFVTLGKVSQEKNECRRAFRPDPDGVLKHRKLQEYCSTRTEVSYIEPEERTIPSLHAQLTSEYRLMERLNTVGEAYHRSIEDTGVYTVLKFLNDLEAEALDVIVERDAPELKGQVERFNANTKFTYKTLGIEPDRPPDYLPNRMPLRDLVPSDRPTYSNDLIPVYMASARPGEPGVYMYTRALAVPPDNGPV